MLIYCPSTVHPTYPKIHFRIMSEPLSQQDINRKFQNYISISICHCNRAYFRDLSLLHLKTMNGVISWCVLALQLQLLSGVSRSGLLPSLVINTTGLVQFGKNYLHSPLRITFCRISP